MYVYDISMHIIDMCVYAHIYPIIYKPTGAVLQTSVPGSPALSHSVADRNEVCLAFFIRKLLEVNRPQAYTETGLMWV